MKQSNFGLTLLLIAAGCLGGGCALDPDAAPHPDATAIEECEKPDLSCPVETPGPFAGAPCEGDLVCELAAPDVGMRWNYTCENGRWAVTCTSDFDGGCPVPIAEYCGNPFAGTSPGGSVDIGPASATEAFRPFEPSEPVTLIWGPQGLPMLPFRVRLNDVEGINCVQVQTTLKFNGEPFGPDQIPVTLRCGESLTVYTIVFFDLCADPFYDVEVEVTVDGVGTTSAMLRFEGVCPG